MNAMIGTIMAVGFNFEPKGWLVCAGQLASIQLYPDLYAVLGTTYGGDGKTSFALPNLCGRTIIGSQGVPATGLGPVDLGEQLGVQSVSVTASVTDTVQIGVANLPGAATGTAQIGGLTATSILHATPSGPGATSPAGGAMLSNTGTGLPSASLYLGNATPSTPLPAVALSDASVKTVAGGTAAFAGAQIGSATPQPLQVTTQISTHMSVMQPSLALNYIICVNGLPLPPQS